MWSALLVPVREFDKGDEKAYFLSGEVKIKPSGDDRVWSGMMNLPKVKLPIEPE